MTVEELIKKLEYMRKDCPVYICRTTDDYFYETKEILSTDDFGGIVVID